MKIQKSAPNTPSHMTVSAAVRACLRRCREFSSVASAGGLILGAGAINAQTVATGPAQPVTDTTGLAEIVVTAQRRSQTVQDIPYNITAVEGSQIQASGATTLNDLTRVVPGLTTVDEGPGARGRTNNLTLRGLETNSPGGGKSPAEIPGQSVSTVSTYFGETPVFFPMPLYDVERVEVLRGPQGTLYGSGSEAGTIRFVPNRPQFDAVSGELQVEASATEHAIGFDNLNRDVKGILNLPIADHLALRLVAGREHDGGFIDNDDLWARQGSGYHAVPIPRVPGDLTSGPVLLPEQKDTNTTDQWFARGALRWQPTTSVDLQVDYLHQYINSANTQYSNPGYAGGPLDLTTSTPGVISATNPAHYPNSTFVMRPGGTYVSTAFTESPYHDTTNLVSAVATVDLGLATITSATSYDDDSSLAVSDFTSTIYGWGGTNYNSYFPYLFYPRLLAVQPTNASDHSFVQELRLVSSGDNRIDYVAGLFYQREVGFTQVAQFMPGITTYLDSIGQHNPTTYADNTWLYRRGTQFQDRAAFGELTWHVTHRWQVTGGGRLLRQTFSVDATSQIPLCGALCAADLTNPSGLSVSSSSFGSSKFLKKLNTSYDLTAELKIYATYAEGFRRGGANALPLQGVFASLPIYQTFAPDVAKNFEIGIKGSVLDRRVRYSADVYRVDLNDFQFDAVNLNALPATYNGTRARSQGVEIEVDASLSRNTRVSIGYNYTDAKITQSFEIFDYPSYALIPSLGGLGQTASVFGGPIRAGSKLPGVPENTSSISVDHTIPLPYIARDVALVLHVDGSYRSAAVANISPQSLYNWSIPSSFIGNARATFDTGGRMIYDLFVNNFTDTAGYSGGQNAQNVPNYSRFRYVSRPRTYGLGMRYKF